MRVLTNRAAQFVVLVVVISILDMIPSHDLYLAKVSILFPVEKVDFLEQLLLMMLELANHDREASSLLKF